MWIGSNNGLFRFDGKRFKQFMYSNTNPASPGDNIIVDIEEDGKGNLWMAGFINGVTRYNMKTGEFRQYRKLSGDNLPAYPVRCIFRDSDNQLWFGTAVRGLAKYQPDRDTFLFYYPDPIEKDSGTGDFEITINGMVQDNTNKDILWIATSEGLYGFDRKEESFVHYGFPAAHEVPGLDHFLCIEKAGNSLYLGTWFEGMVKFDKSSEKFSRIPYSGEKKGPYRYLVLDLQLVNDSLLYLASGNDGLLEYHIRNQKLETVLAPKDVVNLNGGINIQKVSLTPHAGFFAGGNSALYQLHPGQNKFRSSYAFTGKHLSRVIKGTLSPSLNTMLYDESRKGYWAGVYNHAGVYFFQQDSFKTVHFDVHPGKTWINDMAIDRMGNLWAVGADHRVYRLNEQTRKIEPAGPVIGQKEWLKEKSFSEIESDGKGNFWLAGSTDVLYYDCTSNNLRAFPLPLDELRKNSPRGIDYFSLRTDGRGNAWMSSNAGLLQFSLQHNKVSYYFDSIRLHHRLASRAIKSMEIDREDRLWLGYFNEGIQVLDTKTMSIAGNYTMEDGLPSMEINYLLCDRDNHLLACLHNGLAVYNPSLSTWQTFTALDGLQRDYLDKPAFGGPGNQVVLLQDSGFVVFQTDSLWKKYDSSVTHISAIAINGENYRSGLLPDYIQEITLPPSGKDIRIEFAATSWLFPFRTRYFFRVDGIHREGEWIKSGEAVAGLTGLASGTYTFRFYAVTSEGSRTPEKILKITIRPPFYKTSWFVLLCILTGLAVLYGLYRYRIGQLRKMQEIRNSISRDLHDDIGASISNINILNELAKRNAGNPEKSKEYLEKAGEDIRRISEGLGDIVWNINPRFDDPESLYIRMKRYAADMFDGKGIEGEFQFPERDAGMKLSMTQRRDVYLIFKEAVNNLVKYSGARHAMVSITCRGRNFTLRIRDDGKGFDRNQIRSGNGLQNMEHRAAALGAAIVLQAEPGKGTEIVLELETG